MSRRFFIANPVINLPEYILTNYKAAGILPFKRVYHGTYGLMGSQHHKKSFRRVPEFTLFGGKRESFDTGPWETALREFHQETNFYFQYFRLNPVHAVFGCGGYVLYFCELPFIDEHSIPTSHEKLGYKWFNYTEMILDGEILGIPKYIRMLLEANSVINHRRILIDAVESNEKVVRKDQ